MRVVLKLLSGCIAVCAFICLAIGIIISDVAILSVSVFLIWISAFVSGSCRGRVNIIYLFFLFTFFIFLLSRVMVRWINEGDIYKPFTDEVMIHTYICLFISIVGLWLGSTLKLRVTLGSKNAECSIHYYDPMHSSINLNLLRQLSCVMTVVAGLATLILNVEKIVFFGMTGSDGALRTDFFSTLPSFVLQLSGIYVLMFCIYLATMPGKKSATVMFILYLAICATKMLFGSRNDFVLGLMFMIVYYIMRDYYMNKNGIIKLQKWLGKKEIVVFIISVPLLIILVVFVGYYRQGGKFEFSGLYETLLDFFDSQGTSIQIIGQTYEHADELKQPHFLYLFDNTWTFIKTNPLSSLFFGTEAYGTNTIERALYGTSLDMSLYYIIYPTSYLSGNGGGSSYVAEAYLGYGYIGLVIVNIFLGSLIEKIYEFKYKSFAGFVVSLVFIQQLFFMPRAGFDEFLADLTSTTQILSLFVLWTGYKLIIKNLE